VSRWSIGNGSINEFSFSPDNVLLAIVSQDGFLRIFNYEKMELVAYMKSYFGGLLCVSFFDVVNNIEKIKVMSQQFAVTVDTEEDLCL
jgi:WD40 repeat protein